MEEFWPRTGTFKTLTWEEEDWAQVEDFTVELLIAQIHKNNITTHG